MCLNLIFHPFKVHQPRPNHIKQLIGCIFKGLTMKSYNIGAIFLLNSNIKLFNLVNCSILRLVFHAHWKNRNYFVSDVELRSWHFWLVNWQQLFWKQVKKTIQLNYWELCWWCVFVVVELTLTVAANAWELAFSNLNFYSHWAFIPFSSFLKPRYLNTIELQIGHNWTLFCHLFTYR